MWHFAKSNKSYSCRVLAKAAFRSWVQGALEIVILVIATLGAICWAVTVGQAPGYAVTCTAHQILAVSLCDTETAAIPVPQMRKSRLRVGGGVRYFASRVSDSVCLGWNLRMCISGEFPGATAGLGGTDTL